MIELRGIRKTWGAGSMAQPVARNITHTFPKGSAVGLLGGNGAGKTSLLYMISGTVKPDRGRVIRHGTVSWPIGQSGSFHRKLTGVQNLRFVARIHGIDSDALLDFVQDFTEIGRQINAPLVHFSSGMRARLSFAISIGIHFDTYLIDEVTAVGDARFREKCRAALAARLETSGMILVSHSRKQIRQLCTSAVVLHRGKLTPFDDVREALAHHAHLLGVPENRRKGTQDPVPA